MEIKGPVLGLDLGDKRIGVAISDPLRIIAAPDRVIKRRSRAEDFDIYREIVAESSIALVVVGLPLMLDGSDSQQTRWVRDYSAALQEALQLPVVLWDESWTTAQAEEALKQSGVRRKKLREKVDAVAAALILQSFLDSQRA